MPPRKKTKASATSTPLADSQPKTPQETGVGSQLHDQSSPQNDDALNDSWTDDQEIQLFKNMIRWKPTGIHKHFRMIQIHSNMKSHGFVIDDAPHTRIPGVWRKLHQLYDLRALDERENAYAFSDLPDPLDPEEAYDIPEFELPEDDFGELMWERRFRGPESVVSSSPPFIPIEEDKALYHPGIGLLRDLPEGSSRSRKAESTSGATPNPRTTKNTRASRSAAKAKGEAKGAKSGQNAKASKAQSAVSESADEDEEDDEEDDEESSSESEAETAPSTRRTNRSNQRAKPVPNKRTRKR